MSVVPEYVMVFVTAKDEEEAARLLRALVEKKLAACGNIIRGARSIYRWEGSIHDETEALMIIKTRLGLFSALEEEVRRLHSYSTPEILALPVAAGSEAYLKWINASTT